LFAFTLTTHAGVASNEKSTALKMTVLNTNKVSPKFPPASDSYSKRGTDSSAKFCKETSKESAQHDLSLLSDNSWLPKQRDEKGTTKDPQEPAPKVGDKVKFSTQSLSGQLTLLF